MRRLVIVFQVFILILMVLPVIAQPGSNPGEPAPIDGGIGLLLAAGAIYGSKKIYDLKNKR